MAGPGPWDPTPRPAGARLAEEAPWARFRAELEHHVTVHGTADVPSQHRTPSGYRLGLECGQYRTSHRNGHLPAAQTAWLDSQPGWWWWPARRTVQHIPEENHECAAA